MAEAAVNAGAEIINDISGLKFDQNIGLVAAKYNTGLVLMHLRGNFETMHQQEPVEDIVAEVSKGFHWSLEKTKAFGLNHESIVLDIGIGLSKTFAQNLELLARLSDLNVHFKDYPL